MSSRQTQSSGRGGRGGISHSGRNQSKSGKSDAKPKKREMKFHPLGSKGHGHYGSFVEVKDALVRRLAKKKLEDIIESVNRLILFDIKAEEPVRKYSNLTDAEDKALKNYHFGSEWSSKHKYWLSQKESFEANLLNLYGTIYDDFCTEDMQDKLAHEPDYRTLLINNPVDLLKRIQKLMTTSDEADYELFGLWEALKKLTNTSQGKDESVPDYRRRWDSNSKALEALIGTKVFYQFICNTQGYAAQTGNDAKSEYIQTSWDRMMASAFLYNCNRKRHQDLIDELNKKFALKHLSYEQCNEFPTTVENVALLLARRQAKLGKDTDSKSKKRTGDGGSGCQGNGGGTGTQATGTAFAQTGGTGGRQGGKKGKCHCCGQEEGHYSPGCDSRFKPQNEWFNPSEYRNYSALQVGTGTTNGGTGNNPGNASHIQVGGEQTTAKRRVGFNVANWAMVQVAGGQFDHPDPNLLLAQFMEEAQDDDNNESLTSNSQLGFHVNRDNYEYEYNERRRAVRDNQYGYKDIDVWDCGSNFDMLCTPDHTDPGSIRRLRMPFEYHANTGFRALDEECQFEQRDKRYLDCSGMTNIKSMSVAVDNNWRVRYDSAIDDAFYAYPPNATEPIVYRRHPHWGLYIRPIQRREGPPEVDPHVANPGDTTTPVVIHDTDPANGPNHSNNNNNLSGYSGLQTVEKNKEGFTARQV